ncbi:transposase [Streptomyces sp. NBC_00286]|uniref:transposase n=1 Tax=Streptomyces sp. NBC_00286 TaxID=2975701 RepID=UPI003FA684A5
MARPSPYSPEFREEAVQLALKSSKPVAHVARELNVNPEPSAPGCANMSVNRDSRTGRCRCNGHDRLKSWPLEFTQALQLT